MSDEKEIVTVENNFPSNSNGDNIQKDEKIHDGPIIKKVNPEDRVVKKKTFLNNFLEASSDAFRFALDEIIVPNIKKIAVDAGNTLMYRAIYKEDAPPPSRRNYYDDWDYPVTRYNSYYSKPRTYTYDDRRYEQSRYSRNRNELPPLLFRAESNARDFLDNLFSALEKYHEITVNNVYDSYGNPDYLREIDYTWNGYGWTDEPNRDLRGSTVSRVKDGFLVILPKPVPLER